MVVTTLTPAPGLTPGWLPAAEKRIGTVLAMPSPLTAKAAIASHGQGAKMADRPATSMPAAETRHRYAERGDRTQPVAHAIAKEAHQRHRAGKGAEGEAGGGDVAAEFLAQIERAPVEHRTFRIHA